MLYSNHLLAKVYVSTLQLTFRNQKAILKVESAQFLILKCTEMDTLVVFGKPICLILNDPVVARSSCPMLNPQKSVLPAPKENY